MHTLYYTYLVGILKSDLRVSRYANWYSLEPTIFCTPANALPTSNPYLDMKSKPAFNQEHCVVMLLRRWHSSFGGNVLFEMCIRDCGVKCVIVEQSARKRTQLVFHWLIRPYCGARKLAHLPDDALYVLMSDYGILVASMVFASTYL